MPSGNLSPSEVKSIVSSLDCSNKEENEKAVMKGTKVEGKSSAGGYKESGFSRGTKKGKG